MAISIKVYPEDNLMLSVHDGVVDDKSFIKTYEDLFKKHEAATKMNKLVILKDTSSEHRSPQALRVIIAFIEKYSPKIKPKIAIVATKEVSFGMARMYQAFTEPYPILVTKDFEEACTFLNIREATRSEIKKKVC
jgi:hypothetical protein